MSERRHRNVINIDELEPLRQDQGRFACECHRLADNTGAAGVGCSHYTIPPGKTAFPAELSLGAGTLRIGDRRVAVRAGDFVTLPVGPDHAHQLINDSDAPLRYLCMSTKIGVEVVGYPDSDKIAAIASPWVAKWYRSGDDVDYFDGEGSGAGADD
jgi:uncharacterized RmlC-like cupin family protein